MSPKQAKFVSEYLVDLNATKAAERSGYKQPRMQGCRLMTKDNIKQAIQAEQTRRARASETDEAFVLAGLAHESKNFSETGTAAARVRSLELIGQHRGMWPDKPPSSQTGGTNVSVNVVVATAQRLAAKRIAHGGPVGEHGSGLDTTPADRQANGVPAQ